MHGMDDVAKKILAGKKLKKAEPGKGKVKLPPITQKMKAESKAPAKSPKAPPKSAPKAQKMSKRPMGGVLPDADKQVMKEVNKVSAKPFAKLEADLPKGGKGAMKVAKELGEEGLEGEAKVVAKKGLGRLGKAAMGAAALAPVMTGVGLLMEGLDAEEAGSEEEQMESAAMRQSEKTAGLVKGTKKLPDSVKASTKRAVKKAKPAKALPKAVKKAPAIEKKPKTEAVYSPKGKSDDQVAKEYDAELKRNFGSPEDDDLTKLVTDVEMDEMDKRGLKRTSPRIKVKKPVDVTGEPFGSQVRKLMKR